MNEESLLQLSKKLEKYIMTLPSAKKFNTLGTVPRKAMMELSDNAYSLRVNVAGYFGTDDSREQAMYLEEATRLANVTGEAVLQASWHDLLDPADVAQLGALVELIKERLK